jgi:hypothetical protein
MREMTRPPTGSSHDALLRTLEPAIRRSATKAVSESTRWW